MSDRKTKLRIYTDTSVIGGCRDAQFAADSLRLIELARQGSVILLVSALLIDELENAPPAVQNVLPALPETAVEVIPMSTEITQLRDAYLKAAIVGPKWRDDATHVAIASVARADAIVLWNFKHIVHLGKIRRYNQVNRELGYPDLVIVTPTIVTHENET